MIDFYNVDCIEFMKKIGGGSVDLTLTDIPYDEVNMATENGLRKINKGKADEITFDLNIFLEEVYRVTKGTLIIFCGQGQFSKIIKYFWDLKDYHGENILVRQLVWKKSNPSPINGEHIYLSAVENAVWVKKQKGTFNAFCKPNVFEFPTGQSEIHPTEKNHKLLEDLIKDNSKIGDLVFDPCAGSGSTLFIANKLGRKIMGCELDKEFYSKAYRRLEQEVSQVKLTDLYTF